MKTPEKKLCGSCPDRTFNESNSTICRRTGELLEDVEISPYSYTSKRTCKEKILKTPEQILEWINNYILEYEAYEKYLDEIDAGVVSYRRLNSKKIILERLKQFITEVDNG